jgi:hypothetical protein
MPWPLLAVLTAQSGLSIRLIWSNTAYQDEALYLWTGHVEITHLLYHGPIPQLQTYMSGAPVMYPIIGAIADSYGGLAAARALSLVFMLAATTLLYLTASRLFGWRRGRFRGARPGAGSWRVRDLRCNGHFSAGAGSVAQRQWPGLGR